VFWLYRGSAGMVSSLGAGRSVRLGY
jgi:hypothetical protein